MKIIINGANGRMGKVVTRCFEEGFGNFEKIIRVDKYGEEKGVKRNLSDCDESADCIIDFSTPLAINEVIDYAVNTLTPVVLATTGYNEEELKIIDEASKKIPIFKSGNMSVGIATLAKLAKQAVKIFPEANIEIIDTHHNQKVDVPSGTALMLAESVKEERDNGWFLVGRHEDGRRTNGEIGIHSLRLGNVFGDHEVIINTGTETISLKHQAHTRDIFAEGSLVAAEFIIGKPAGMYNMYDIVN